MENKFTVNWTMANAIGLSLGFLAFLQTLHFYAWGFEFSKHWDWEASDNLDTSVGFLALGLAFGLPIFGAVFSAAQAVILKNYVSKVWRWILHGAIGFALVAVIILPLAGIWGHIDGPVEPLTIVFVGAVMTFILQWRFLKKRGINPKMAFILFSLGAIMGVLILWLLFMAGLDVPWAMEVAIIGLVVGGSAGFISAKKIEKALKNQNI